MICSNCGKEIKEDALYCEECGAPLEEPIVLNISKDDIKNAEKKLKTQERKNIDVSSMPFFDYSAYIKGLTTNVNNIIALIGGILLYIAPFGTWLWEKLLGEKSTASLFDLAGDKISIGLDQPVLTVCAVMLIVCSIMMIIMSGREYFRLLKPYEDNYIMRFMPVFIALVVYVIVDKNEAFNAQCEAINELIKNVKMLGLEENYSGGKGSGPVFFMLGLICYSASIILDGIGKKK